MSQSVILTTQPATSLTVVPNQNTTLTVVASASFSSPTYTYQWKKNNVHVSGATTFSYFFEPSVSDNSKVYYCMVSALSGETTVASVTSTGLTLTVESESSGDLYGRHISGAVANSNPANESGRERFLRAHHLGYF